MQYLRRDERVQLKGHDEARARSRAAFSASM
jgi:hypothetical protein